MNEFLIGAIRIFNEFSDLFEFMGSRDGFREMIKGRMHHSSCVCYPRNFFLLFLFFSLNVIFSKNVIFNFSLS
jgi:hypothetical protein